MARGVFIAGTDTGIGKTYVSCTLLQALRANGLRATGMKPVASGCERTRDGLRNDDALALIAASDPRPDYATCNPYAFLEPVSPHLAAGVEGVEIQMTHIAAAYARLAADANVVVVEGVGGWLAPLSETLNANAIPQGLRLPVILVVSLKLGCLNHAQLSARAILADRCELLGWIGNRIDPQMTMVEENLDTLRRLLPARCLGVLEHDADPARSAVTLQSAIAALIGLSA
ncbi:MAG: dethiobiotin synthase [Rhodanobacteraceae bacterium]